MFSSALLFFCYSHIWYCCTLYQTFKVIQDSESVEFDFSHLTQLVPLLVLPIAAYESTTDSNHRLLPDAVKQYAQTMHFPTGITTVNELGQAGHFLPITLINVADHVSHTKLESAFQNLLSGIIGAAPGSHNALYYPIGELITNIFDHSHSSKGWLLAQWYPDKDYLDLCIVDRGRGLTGGYREELSLSLRDEDALQRAMRGVSTKKLKERGYGLRTSKRVVCEALGGSFVLLSGGAAFVAEGKEERITPLPTFDWQGVIVAYRIPKPKKSIDTNLT